MTPRPSPALTLEAARAFHARYYHPSNCRIFLYGDIPLDDILTFLDENFLSAFSAIDTGLGHTPAEALGRAAPASRRPSR